MASIHPHYLTFTLQTCHHPVHQFRSWPTQTTSPSHPHTQARVQPRNTYNHTYIKFLPGQNKLILNLDKTTCTLFTPDPAEYTSNLDLKINNNALPMTTQPKVLGLTLDTKLTYSTHIHNMLVHTHKPLQIIKKHSLANYKAVIGPAVEYACSIWSPLASSTSIIKLQVMQNAALRTATGYTQDTNICMTKHIHTFIVSRHQATRGNNKILCTTPPHISRSEEILPRITHRYLAQLRTNKSPLLKSYLHKVDAKTHPSPLGMLFGVVGVRVYVECVECFAHV